MNVRAWIAALSLVPVVALADANITVDGSEADWPTTTSQCFSGATGGGGGIDLVRACLQNNNTSGDVGRLFGFFRANANVPTNTDTYYGIAIDLDRNGTIGSADEIWVVYFPPNVSNTTGARLQVYNPNNLFAPKRQYTTTTSCGGTGTSNGWTAVRSGTNIEVGIAYGCIGLSYCDDGRTMYMGVYPAFDLTPSMYYNGTSSTLTDPAATVTNATAFTALSGNRRVTLNWTNATNQQGALVLRRTGAAPTGTPTNGTGYAVGATIGNGTVVYSSGAGCGGPHLDNPTSPQLVNGTRYYYKVFSRRALRYSTGATPSSSGLFSEPTTGTSPSVEWCYSTGFTTGVQPVADLGIGIFSAGNSNAVTANLSSISAAIDGAERWRPVVLNGPVQSRFPVVALGGAGKYIITGDQSGRAYAIDATAGTLLWTANSGAALTTRFQAQPNTQLYAFGNTAYRAANPNRDLAFFATAEFGVGGNPATTNKVFTLDAATGAIVRTYSPGNLDYVSGGMIVDYTNNRLWIGTRGDSGTHSVRVISTIATTIDGTNVDRKLSLGKVDTTLARSADGTQAYIVDNTGLLYAYSLATMTEVWRQQLSPLSAPVFAIGGGFIVSRGTANLVERYTVSGTTVTLLWSRAISVPSGVNVHFGQQKVYVGDSNGVLHQLNVATGVDEKQVTLSSGSRLFPASIDEGQSRLHLGTQDGRLCALTVPLP